MNKPADVLKEMNTLKAASEPFAVATVVRTVALTAAKAGAKALIRADGTMSAGWIGGGCARVAVLKAAREALSDGKPRLVSVQPGDALQELGVEAGQSAGRLAAVRSPARLNIGAVTPEEIALSVLADIVELRRRGARTAVVDGAP
jgi:xanthine dehydrogenase accessory factor